MLKVLVIDDTRSVHAYLRKILQGTPQVQLTDVYSGAEGLAALDSLKGIDVILLDWEMPGMNGPETLKQIMQSGKKVPVIMMTTKNAPEEILQMLDCGAAEYLMKPFTLDILMQKIESTVPLGQTHVA